MGKEWSRPGGEGGRQSETHVEYKRLLTGCFKGGRDSNLTCTGAAFFLCLCVSAQFLVLLVFGMHVQMFFYSHNAGMFCQKRRQEEHGTLAFYAVSDESKLLCCSVKPLSWGKPITPVIKTLKKGTGGNG